MTTLDPHTSADELPRWSVTDLYESFDARPFADAMDRTAADVTRLEALFDEHDIRATAPRPVTAADGAAADAAIGAINAFRTNSEPLEAYIYATTSTDSYDERAEALMGEFTMSADRERPMVARLA
ncbi:MAG: hypothetical protein RJA49_2752, partial [Actinomycetota bacterium]